MSVDDISVDGAVAFLDFDAPPNSIRKELEPSSPVPARRLPKHGAFIPESASEPVGSVLNQSSNNNASTVVHHVSGCLPRYDATTLLSSTLTAAPPTVEGTGSEQRTSTDPCSCLLYTSPSPRDQRGSRMPSSA